nr:hypothetical protein [Tanacetum cinerariifolium]
YINSPSWNRPTFYKDDEEHSIKYKEYLENSFNAIAPVLQTKEPDNSLIMEDEHLSTILEMESDKVIKSSVKNLVPIPCESEVTSDNETDFDLEEEIRLVENLLYDNSLPRPPEELNAKIADTIVESLAPSSVLVEDSDSQMEEIDLFLDTDDLIPSGIESDNYESEGDFNFIEEFLSDDSLYFPKNESSYFDHHNDSSFHHPLLEPPDVEIFFYFKPNMGVLTAKVVKGISKHYVFMPRVLPSLPNLCLNIDSLISFSSENEDKVFNPSILSYLLVSHQDKITFDFSENPMMIFLRTR